MVYPRKCPGCGVLTDEDGFARDRYQPSGRKSRCKACCNSAAETYHHTVRKPRRQVILEAERAAEMKVLEREHKRRLKAVNKEAAERARRQKEFLRSIGVPDLTPEEVSERARAAALPQVKGRGQSPPLSPRAPASSCNCSGATIKRNVAAPPHSGGAVSSRLRPPMFENESTGNHSPDVPTKGSHVDSLDHPYRHPCIGPPWLPWPGTLLRVAAAIPLR
jgi:hypothetical protein